MLELQNIVKSFDGVQVIKGVSLKIQDGEFISLLGPSGCGKTTCLRMIAGFEQQDSGHLILDGKVLDNVPPYKRPLNTLFQNYALFPHMTVFDNIAYGLKMHNEKKLLIKEKVMEAIKMVRLEGFEKRYPCEMSGGQRQRVAIARAVVNHPPILLLDEPLTALDAKLRIEMRYELRSLQKKLGITFIYVTHDQEEALVMSDRIVVMNKGAIEQVGTPADIYYNPETKFVSSFIGETNLFDAVVEEANGITMELEGEAGCCIADDNDCFKQGEIVNVSIRPDKVLWSKTPVEDFSFVGKVTDVVFSGAATKVFVELANGAEFKITRLSAEKLPQLGDELYLSWKSSDCVVMHSISQEFTSTIQNIDLGRWVRETT